MASEAGREARQRGTFRSAGAAHPAGAGGTSRVSVRRLLVGVAGAAGLLAAVLANAYLLAGPLGSRLSAVNSLVSELEVPGQPTSTPLRLVDATTGLLIVIFAVGLLLRLPRQARNTVGVLFLALFGIATVADTAYPMTCTPSTDPSCRRIVDNLSPLAQLHHPHTICSVIAVFSVVMAMLLLSRAPAVRAWSPWLGPASAGAGILVSTFNVAELPLIALGRWVGVLERGYLLLTSVWIVMLAGYLVRDALIGAMAWRRPGGS
jgi:hypothetical protein